MSAVETKLVLNALDALARGPRRYAPDPAVDAPIVTTRRNPADTCDCGEEAVATEYRNGREIGVCGNCR